MSALEWLGRGASRDPGSGLLIAEFQGEATTGPLQAERLVGRPEQTHGNMEHYS